MADIFVEQSFYMGTSDACIIDLTPPTFAGINFLDVESRGQIRAGWAAATDATAPIRYEVYIQASTATGLFNTANIAGITSNLSLDIFTMPDGSFLQNGTTYFVGVRAVDAVSNRDANTVSLSVISTGVLTSIDTYECKAIYSIDDSNNFRITLWANKNGNLAVSPGAVLGTASYQVYDKLGNAVSGMSATGITANGQGLFSAPAVANLLPEHNQHYEVKVTISVDGENRVGFVGIDRNQEIYEINGTGAVTTDNILIGSFWISENEVVVTSGLGTGSYQVYRVDGTLVPGFAESGLVADVNGYFHPTPLPLPPSTSTTEPTIVRYTVVIDGIARSRNIIFAPGQINYTNRATFSINASNQLEATFWATINDVLVTPSVLGTASYLIYDKLGNLVSGLSQTGIVADSNGFFHTTPVSAVLLTDLTHYTAQITIEVAGQDRVVAKGFTLLGT